MDGKFQEKIEDYFSSNRENYDFFRIEKKYLFFLKIDDICKILEKLESKKINNAKIFLAIILLSDSVEFYQNHYSINSIIEDVDIVDIYFLKKEQFYNDAEFDSRSRISIKEFNMSATMRVWRTSEEVKNGWEFHNAIYLHKALE